MKGLMQSCCLKVSHHQQESCLSAPTALPDSVIPYNMETSSFSIPQPPEWRLLLSSDRGVTIIGL